MSFQEDLIKLNELLNTKEEAIRYCGKLLFQGGYVEEDYIEAMIQRDNDFSVCMRDFIATPHRADEAKGKVLKSGITVVQVPDGVNFGTEGNPQIVTALLGIAGIGSKHLETIQKISILCTNVDNVVKLADVRSKDEIIRLLNNME